MISMTYELKQITENHLLLLLTFYHERSYSDAKTAIEARDVKNMPLGRTILPCTQELVDWGFVERTNPGASRRAGHRHITTAKGKEVVEACFEKLRSLSQPGEGFVFYYNEFS